MEIAYSLGGVTLGFFLALVKDFWSEWRTKAKAAHYLAIRVVFILDKFLDQCAEVVNDDGLCHGQLNSDGYREPQVVLPTGLALPEDVNWKSIKSALMYRILSLPGRVEVDNRAIAFSWEISGAPDFDEVFEERVYRYACLGLDTAEISRELRNSYRIPARDFGGWDPVQNLRDEKKRIEDKRKAAASRPSFLDFSDDT